MEVEDGAPVVVVPLVGHLLVLIGVAEDSQELPGKARAGFDDVGNIAGVPVVLVDVLHVLAREFLMPGEIVIGAVVHPLKFLEAHGEFVLDVVGVLGVVGQLVLAVAVPAQFIHPNAQLFVVRPALFSPVIEELVVLPGLYEVLHFHLLELAGTENEVLGDDFVAEGLAYLGDPEGYLHSVGLDDVLVVDVDALGGFGAQVYEPGPVVHGTYVGLEHEVELAGIGQLAAAIGTFFARQLVLVDLVGPESGFAFLAIHQGVGEVLHVPRGFPDPGMHEDSRVQAHYVVVELGHFLPPKPRYAVFELDSHRSVVPGPCLASVDFRRLKDKSPSLGQRDDFFHAE
ncbi:putative Predicted transcriptional regulator [uncultured Spirochaetota bacterium]|uniref:Putative Predicted transcriptional regulator n=1 Tax=uncultured Spirochaetota bacterium TaxID=460511 RepID=A0A652ZYD4_9SPIR|nr:putative Predicted transcriptional regulator [uncultured Spirochaetota bacterium]